MQPIIVGAVVIANHDIYWKYKQNITQMQDYVYRGFDITVGEINTPFAISTGDLKNHSVKEFLEDVITAVGIFEERFPLKTD